jgi:GTP:adenosylcobinamide-phosphate guanylyltransferase
MKINIIIPMGGEGARFGHVFKPFLYLDNRKFIEHTLDEFIKYDLIIE